MILAQRYEVAELVGRGGMADVYRAHDRLLDRDVAVKVFRADPADLRRFRSEVSTLARLNHPNLVRLFDAGEHEQVPYFVLELVAGPTLARRLAEGALLPAEVAELGTQLASALAYVHEAGIVHRDVKPSNILLTPDQRALLSDFGVARLLDASAITATGVTVGSAAYLAPEQATGQDVTAAADVYALGLVLLEALTGQPGFAGTPNEMLLARLSGPPTLPDLPHPWAELLAAMLARDPQVRPKPKAIIDALNDAEATRSLPQPAPTVTAVAAPTVAAGPTPVPPPDVRRAHRPLWALAAAGAVAVMVLIVGALAFRDGGSPPQDPPTDVPAPAATVATTTPTTRPTTRPSPPTTREAATDRGARCREIERQKEALEAAKKVIEQARLDKEISEQRKDDLDEQKKALESQKKLAGC